MRNAHDQTTSPRRFVPDFLSAHHWYGASALIILLVAAGLRFYRLGDIPVWFDEAAYVAFSQGSFSDMISQVRGGNSSPLLLPLFTWIIQGVGDFTFAYRLPSALAGVGTVAVVLLLPRVGVPAPVALASASVLAASESQIRYSQEIREYSLGVFTVVVLVYFALKTIKNHSETGPRQFPLGLVATSAVIPWVSYGPILAALAVLGVMVLVGIVSRGGARYWVSSGSAVGALMASSALSYVLVARYQFWVTTGSHLDDEFPASSGLRPLEWLLRATERWGRFLVGYDFLLLLFVAGLGLSTIAVVAKALGRRDSGATLQLAEAHFVVILTILGVLLGGLWAAAFLDLYPFGPIRQQLFAAPLLVLGGAYSLWFLLTSAGRVKIVLMTVLGLGLLVAQTGLTHYSERDSGVKYELAVSFVLQQLESRESSTTRAWIHPGIAPMFSYYAPEEAFPLIPATDSESEFLAQLAPQDNETLVLAVGRTSEAEVSRITRILTATDYSVAQETFDNTIVFVVTTSTTGGGQN